MSARQPIVWGVVAAVGLAAAPVRGQDAGAASGVSQYLDERSGLGLDMAIARALEREPSLRAARADVEVKRGARVQASLRPNPTLTVERRGEPAGTDSLTTVGATWPLDLFRRGARVTTADREVQATAWAVADQERRLAADVRARYGAVAAAVRELLVTDDLIAAVRQQWDALRARVTAGGSAPLERDLLEVELRRLEVERLLTAGRADAAAVALKQSLGMTPDEPLRLRDSLEALVEGRPLQPAVPTNEAIAARPDVREAEARITVAEARVDQARREGRPDVSVFGTYMRMNSGFPQLGIGASGVPERVGSRFHYVSAGAMVTVPVRNRNQGQLAMARAERSGAEARREAAALAARADVAAAEARDARAQQALRLYASGVRRLARQNLDVVRQTFELGRATIFDVLAEQRRYLDSEQAYVMALREAWDAQTELARATGGMQ